MNHSSKLLAILLFVFALTACGQSGPLYLPGDPSEVQNLSTELPEPENDEDEDDEDDENEGTSEDDST